MLLKRKTGIKAIIIEIISIFRLKNFLSERRKGNTADRKIRDKPMNIYAVLCIISFVIFP